MPSIYIDVDEQDEEDFGRLWTQIEDHVSGRESKSFAWDQTRPYNVGEKLALVHSEVSEALEAFRKNLNAEHIKGFTGAEEELADVVIRCMGIANHFGMRLPQAIIAKAAFNDTREDHKQGARESEHGKRF